MKNNYVLSLDKIKEIDKLNENDADVVLEYFGNWSEDLPAYFNNGDTIQDKFINMFRKYIVDEYNTTSIDILYYLDDTFNEIQSNYEYDITFILDMYRGNMVDYIDNFEEYIDEYIDDTDENDELIETFSRDGRLDLEEEQLKLILIGRIKN